MAGCRPNAPACQYTNVISIRTQPWAKRPAESFVIESSRRQDLRDGLSGRPWFGRGRAVMHHGIHCTETAFVDNGRPSRIGDVATTGRRESRSWAPRNEGTSHETQVK